jgi:pilus assembly protein TadC
MSIFSLSLIFLSPIIGYATHILLQESKDPLKGFHDNFRKSSRSEVLSLDQQKYNAARLTRNRLILWLYIATCGLLILSGASSRTLIFLVATFGLFRYWERGSAERIKKIELKRTEEEFPSIVELFAVLVSAGESPSTALERVSNRASGVMGEKFAEVICTLHEGKNLTQALEIMGTQVDSAIVRRFCDTLILAMERGTSLSEVLVRQVEEVRSTHHAALLTAAGKAEIALMIPVIFLILPISVLFALWPSYLSLGQSVM